MSALLKKSLLKPLNPERVCWGCDKYCRADDLTCGNGSDRTLHPIELFGEDWLEWAESNATPPPETTTPEPQQHWPLDPSVVFAPVDAVKCE